MKATFFFNHRNIGWSITDNQSIIDVGVKNVNLTPDEYNEFRRGLDQSTNKTRTLQRAARRNLQRWKQRRRELQDYLIQNYVPKINADMPDADLWKQRAKASNEQIDMDSLARVLLHLNNKRGYRAADEGMNENEDSAYLANLEENTNQLHTSGLTIGAFLLRNFVQGERTKGILFKRDDYIAEYWQIMSNQHNISDKAKQEIFDIIYYQRPLKSQKHRVSFCEFTNRRVAHRSNPLFQKFKLLTQIANVKAYDAFGRDIPIEEENYAKLFDELNRKEKMSKLQIIIALGFKRTDKVMLNYDEGLSGNTTNGAILKACKEYDINRKDHYDIWHLIYSVPSKEEKIKVLQAKYGFDEQAAVKLADINFGKLGYSDLSEKAIKALLPQLEAGKHLADAIKATFKKDKKEKVILKTIPHLVKNSLRNIVLEKASNAMINQLNALRGIFDIDEVAIEFDRLMLMSKKGRQRAIKNERSRIKENEQIRKDLYEIGIKEASGNDLLKYKLWTEMNGRSPYEPYKEISLHQLLDKSCGDPYEIEHIIPYSRLFDNSLHNKTVCRRSINTAKDNMTAMDYMLTRPTEEYDEFLLLIDNKNINKTKRRYFTTKEEEISNTYILNRLNIESWFAKALREQIESVGVKVYFNDFVLTNHLKDIWQLRNEMVSDEYEDDLRLLGLNAIVGAFTSDEIKHQLNDLNKNFRKAKEAKISLRAFPLPYDNFRNEVIEKVNNIIVKYKVGDRLFTKDKTGHANPRTQLHKETIYGRIELPVKNKKGETEMKPEFVVKYKLNSLTVKDLPYIYDAGIRAIIEERLRQYGNNAELCWEKLSEVPLLDHQGKQIRSVRLLTGMKKVRALHRDGDKWRDYVSEANNHHMAIYKDSTGKLINIEVSALTAIQRKNAGIDIIITKPKEAIDKAMQDDRLVADEWFWKQMPKADYEYVANFQKRQIVEYNGELYKVHWMSDGRLHLFKPHVQNTNDTSKAVNCSFKKLLQNKDTVEVTVSSLFEDVV